MDGTLFAKTDAPDGIDVDLFERELQLEKEMLERGRDRYVMTTARTVEREAEAATSYGKTLLKYKLEDYAKAIEHFIQEAKSGGAGRRHKALAMLDGMDCQVVRAPAQAHWGTFI